MPLGIFQFSQWQWNEFRTNWMTWSAPLFHLQSIHRDTKKYIYIVHTSIASTACRTVWHIGRSHFTTNWPCKIVSNVFHERFFIKFEGNDDALESVLTAHLLFNTPCHEEDVCLQDIGGFIIVFHFMATFWVNYWS